LLCNLPAVDGVKGPDDYLAVCGDRAMIKIFADASASIECCDYGGGRFEVSDRGMVYIGQPDKDGNPRPPLWICTPLKIAAKTRDSNSGEWGRLLQWQDADGVNHQWAMPIELLQGDGGVDVRKELARQGLDITTTRTGRELLCAALQVWPVEERARCAERLGWHGGVYVIPAETVGDAGEHVVFQNAHAIEPAFAVSGTAEEWREHVAALAQGNSRMIFAVSVAFAGALLEPSGEDSGGFHLRGPSSTGKSTALKWAASVWGKPSSYSRLWRATSNGLEGLAALHNDGLLILDELSQIDPREAGEVAYLLANGRGKTRAARNGTARQSASWRLLFLSAGEESLSTLMARAGRKPTAGQEIRMAEIDADAGAGMGAIEALHGYETASALTVALREAAGNYYGAVGMKRLRLIVADRAKLAAVLADGITQFVHEYATKDGQGERVARRFGVVAAAGDMATRYGLTGWLPGEAYQAVGRCLSSWQESFGAAGNHEERAFLNQVQSFFEQHGASRFEEVGSEGQRVINRAGFFRTDADGMREYLVFPQAFRREVCAGVDSRLATRTLREHGWILPGSDGGSTQKPRLPGIGPTRVYVLGSKMWGSE
jgi:putative DNA primase/helicase